MSRARPFPNPAAPLLVALSLVASACGTEDAPPPPPECTTAATCLAPANPCMAATCVDGRCGSSAVEAGTLVGGGTTGDCLHDVCDGAGAVISAADDADLPADGNACTQDVCSGGVASHPPVQAGTACSQDGGSRCDGGGACVQCLVASDCPGTDTECSTRTCSSGICDATFAPSGTALATQTAGDCLQAVCDGLGGTTTAPLDIDVPSDGNVCTDDRCSGGFPSHPAVAAGTTCSGPSGGVVCDGGGSCVQCLTASACPGEDGECQHRTCIAGACDMAFVPFGTATAAQTPGDCFENVCNGFGDVIPVGTATDVPVDGNACTEDSCSTGAPSNPLLPAGTACAQSGGKVCDGGGACVECNEGADCTTGVCSAHACQAPTCTDLVRNGDETDVDCGGAVCGKCAPPLACLGNADCTTGICKSGHCAAPSCSDLAKNGDETDVDCGGSCLDCARGKSCLANGDCATANCRAGTCAGPLVSGVLPANGAADVTPATVITVLFPYPVSSGSVTAQPASGACTGSVQISADGFASCVGATMKFLSGTAKEAVLQPALPLAGATTYRIRTTTAISSTSSALGAFEPFETPAGFTTAGGGACGGSLVVSQVYPGGGLTGAAYAQDFVELHNNGPVPVSLDGLSVQYAAANSSSWSVTPLAGTLRAGGYYLVREAGSASAGEPLPAADATGTINLSHTGGVVALVSTPVGPPAYTSCLTAGLLDLVGYGATSTGATPTCREGTAAPAPADYGAALARVGGGCGDGNGNAEDFVSQLVVPRSSASPPALCGCNGLAVNGTGLTVEMDWCSVHFPLTLTVGAGQPAGPVYGRIYELGITEPWGTPALTGELGFGPYGTDPRYAAGWTFIPASWNAQAGNEDEFQASFTAPAASGYAYAYRFSPDGKRWTYCDPNGAGSSPGNPFEPNSLPTLTVTP